MKCYACGKLVSPIVRLLRHDVDSTRVIYPVIALLQMVDPLILLARYATSVGKLATSLENAILGIPTVSLPLSRL